MSHHERASFWNRIQSFYSSMPYPEGERIFDNDWYDESCGLKDEFENKIWQIIDLDIVLYYRMDIYYFTVTGFRYFLPKFWQALLFEPIKSDTLIDHFTGRFTPFEGNNDFQVQLAQLMKKEEKELVCFFFSNYKLLYSEEELESEESQYQAIRTAALFWENIAGL